MNAKAAYLTDRFRFRFPDSRPPVAATSTKWQERRWTRYDCMLSWPFFRSPSLFKLQLDGNNFYDLFKGGHSCIWTFPSRKNEWTSRPEATGGQLYPCPTQCSSTLQWQIWSGQRPQGEWCPVEFRGNPYIHAEPCSVWLNQWGKDGWMNRRTLRFFLYSTGHHSLYRHCPETRGKLSNSSKHAK